MASNSKASGLSRDVQENVIENISGLFPKHITKDAIKLVLLQENWDLENSLRKLQAIVESFENSKKTLPQSMKEKKKTDEPPKTNDAFKKKGGKKNANTANKEEKGGWVMVPNSPIKTDTLPTQEKSILNVTNPVESTPSTSSSTDSKKARKKRLSQNYNIIKQFGDPTSRISAYIKEGIRLMVLLRGCSGSGKSTYANHLLRKEGIEEPNDHIFSTDNFFVGSDGKYCFNIELLPAAHEWNQSVVRTAASEGRSPIFVDNTNTRQWEMREYVLVAVEYGYVLETLEPPTPWFFNESVLCRKTTHYVPRETIRKMLDRYEANLNGEDVLRNLHLNYTPPNIPPLGSMQSPLSKKLKKLLNLPREKSVSPVTSNSQPKKSNINNRNSYSTPNSIPLRSCSNIQYTNQLSSLSEELSTLVLKKSKSESNVKVNENAHEQSKGNFTNCSSDSDDESENTCTSSSSEESDSEEESVAAIVNSANLLSVDLEYVLVSKDSCVIFQKEHEEMKEVKSLEDFKKTKQIKALPKNVEEYLKTFVSPSPHNIKDNFIKGNFTDLDIGPGPGSVSKTTIEDKCYCTTSHDVIGTGHPKAFSESETITDPLYLESVQNVAGKKILIGNSHFESIPDYIRPKSFSTAVDTGTISPNEGVFEGSAIDKLHLLFPKVSKQSLIELFGNSLDDIDWAVSILLESGQEMVQPSNMNKEKCSEDVTNKSGSHLREPESKTNEENPTLINPPKKSYICEWDFKNHLPSVLPRSTEKLKQQRIAKSNLRTSCIDISTNTNNLDFEALRSVNTGSSVRNCKVLTGNPVFVAGQPSHPPSVSVLMLEKGTMTAEIETNHVFKLDSGIDRLATMFPRISRDNLEELLEKCRGDIDWVVGLLLDSGQAMSELFTFVEPLENCQVEVEPELADLKGDLNKDDTQTMDKPKKKRKNKIRLSKSNNELHKEIQETIQSNFVLNESCYSSERMKQYFQRMKPPRNIVDEPATSDRTLEEARGEVVMDSSDTEEDIFFMMDSDFILQLQARFGGLIRPNMIGEKTAVNLPLSLARQLHSYIMDSVHQIIEEEEVFPDKDEEYARHLQEEELRSQGVPSLVEIMDEEVALRKSQKHLGNVRSMASTLSKQLLIERFPKMDPSTLASILEDTNHSLHQATCLLASAGHAMVEPEQVTQSPSKKSDNNEKSSLSRLEAIKQANAYGDVASQLYEMRKDCLKKSQKAYRGRNYSVALYYSDMAKWYMERIEKSNSMAAKAILSGYEGWTTLDLHFLQIAEALNVLDLFIDEVVRGLQDSNQKRQIVYVITGRGLHSKGGQPRLKPAVVSHLAMRDLRFEELNPGMLKVVIPRTALTSYKHNDCT